MAADLKMNETPKKPKNSHSCCTPLLYDIFPPYSGIFQWAHQVPILLHAQFFGPFNSRVLKAIDPILLKCFYRDHLVS